MQQPDKFRSLFAADVDDLNDLLAAAERASPIMGSGEAYGVDGANPIVHVPEPIHLGKGFWAKVYIPTGGDFSDERYQVKPVVITNTNGMNDQIVAEAYEPEEDADGNFKDYYPITATNRAEKDAHTHLLVDGMEVYVTAEWDYTDPPGIHYSFWAPPKAATQSYPVFITGNCAGGGKYQGLAYLGSPDVLCDAAALVLPGSMVFDPLLVSLTIAHTKEEGLATHQLETGRWTEGVLRLNTAGEAVIFVADGFARDTGGPTLGSNAIQFGPDTQSWVRDLLPGVINADQYGDTPVDLWLLTALYNDPGACYRNVLPSFIVRLRRVSVDAGGKLSDIGEEMNLEIAKGCCPEATTPSTPSFSTPALAAETNAIYANMLALGMAA